MELVLNTYNDMLFDRFIRTRLPNIMYSIISGVKYYKKLNMLDAEFGIDSAKIIDIAFKSLIITKYANTYKITFDKESKIEGVSISKWINIITYGNRSVQGCRIIYDVFEFIAKNIDKLYKEWLRENGY